MQIDAVSQMFVYYLAPYVVALGLLLLPIEFVLIWQFHKTTNPKFRSAILLAMYVLLAATVYVLTAFSTAVLS